MCCDLTLSVAHPNAGDSGEAVLTSVDGVVDPRPGKWKVMAVDDEGHTLVETFVIGEDVLDNLMADLERRPDFGGSLIIPLPRSRRVPPWARADTPA